MKLLEWYREWLEMTHRCESCETLREQLSIANEEKRQLLQSLQSYHKPVAIIPTAQPEPVPIKKGPIPWKIQREMMEAEDREKARILSTVDKSNEELEKELGIGVDDAGKIG